jgi:SAM-dependent methyltransferase
MSEPLAIAPSHFISEGFARVYEAAAERITGPISELALKAVGGVGPGMRVLDIAAGTGALSVPAARTGADVLGTDISPGMVARLAERLQPFPNAEARVLDGTALDLPDGCYDLTFSIFGTVAFTDWQAGLAEQARVLRTGGRGCIATWREPPGGGPFRVMAEAMRTAFPDVPPQSPPQGMVALSDPSKLADAMRAAGFASIEVQEVEGVWQGRAGNAYLDEMEPLHRFMTPYARLDEEGRVKVRHAIRSIVDRDASGQMVEYRSRVLLATGDKRFGPRRRQLAP